MIKELLPEAKKIGIVYNTSEQNSFYLTDEFKKEAEKNGYEVVIKGITNVNEIASALDTILPEIDVLYTTIDNTIASTYPLIIDKSKKRTTCYRSYKELCRSRSIGIRGDFRL